MNFLPYLTFASPGSTNMGKPMDNMPFSEFYKWLASPPFTGPVGLIAKLYVKEVTTTRLREGFK